MYEVDFPVFKGTTRKGFGLGGTLTSGIYNYAIPLLKKFFSKYKDDIISTGKNIAHDIAIKKIPVKKSIKRRTRQTFRRIISKSKNQKGQGIPIRKKIIQRKRMIGRGIKRKRTMRSSSVPRKKLKKRHQLKKHRGVRKRKLLSSKRRRINSPRKRNIFIKK